MFFMQYMTSFNKKLDFVGSVNLNLKPTTDLFIPCSHARLPLDYLIRSSRMEHLAVAVLIKTV